jgi:hypothetical protein
MAVILGTGPLVGEFDVVVAPGVAGFFAHPDQGGLKLVAHLQWLLRQGDDVAARGVNFFV